MIPEEELSHPARTLSLEQREFYFSNGCLSVSGLLPQGWINRLRQVTADKIDQSRTLTASDDAYDLGRTHRLEAPHARRLQATVDRLRPIGSSLPTRPSRMSRRT